MKHLCCSKIFIFFLLTGLLYASLEQKSALVYYGEDISYPMIGVHDYILVDPKKINTKTHGFALYREKIYPKVVIKKDFQATIAKLLQEGYQNLYLSIKTSNISALRYYLADLKKEHRDLHILVEAKSDTIESLLGFIDGIVFTNLIQEAKADPKKYRELGLACIDIELLAKDRYNSSDERLIREAEKKGMIPYVTTVSMDIYGRSSKNALKREVLTLVENPFQESSAHRYGAMPLEYMGYMQDLRSIADPLLEPEYVASRYAGVLVWLSGNLQKGSEDFFHWLLALKKRGVRISLISEYAYIADPIFLKELGIEVTKSSLKQARRRGKIIQKDAIIGFEIEPKMSQLDVNFYPKSAQKTLLTFEDMQGRKSTPAAIMPWGGYTFAGSTLFRLANSAQWILNPFAYLKESLSLEAIPVPDVTTHNGRRVLFTHVESEGLLYPYETNSAYCAGDMIYNQIITKYKIPHSVSLGNAECSLKKRSLKDEYHLQNVIESLYTLKNVETAINQIVPNCLTPYTKLLFWSNAYKATPQHLAYLFEHNIANINGGHTMISHAKPWLCNVSAQGIQKGDYYQVYAAAESENLYTNYWYGPFWGFQEVVQTFEMTENPRRLKPIDIHYHLYSGSKLASLNALKYVFDWAIQQDVYPLFTSQYIPKVMDFYAVSMAEDKRGNYVVAGMQELKTLRFDKELSIDFKRSKTVLGKRTIKEKTYVHLSKEKSHFLSVTKPTQEQKELYIIDTNAKVSEYAKSDKTLHFILHAYSKLSINLHVPQACHITSLPKAMLQRVNAQELTLSYQENITEAVVDVRCP